MPNKWWETETPTTIRTSKIVLNWYPKARKLQVARPDWTDDNGDARPGKAVVLDIEALRRTEEAARVLESILEVVRGA